MQMLTSLKDECGDPLDRRGLINHCYPNPKLPDGDFELKSIWHRIFIYDDTPASVIRPSTPDLKSRHFWVHENEAHVEIREESVEKKYDVPMELIPEIKQRVRELCADPAEAYVESGDWESFVYFGEDGDERIFTRTEATLELLKYIASKSVFTESKEVEKKPDAGVAAGGMMGFMGFMPLDQQQKMVGNSAVSQQSIVAANKSNYCSCCGAARGGNAFCTECGAKFE